MSDAHTEAERIASEVCQGRRQAMPYHDSESEYVKRYGAMVAALAAAINQRRAENAAFACTDCTDPESHKHALAFTAVQLDEALSALGVSTTEEPR